MEMPKSSDPPEAWREFMAPKPERNAEIRRLRIDKGLSYREIGDKFDLSPESVRAICTEVPKPKKNLADRNTSIIARHLFGESDKDIAEDLGLHPSYVRSIYRRG